jgi:hypothetical protein
MVLYAQPRAVYSVLPSGTLSYTVQKLLASKCVFCYLDPLISYHFPSERA